MADLVQIKKNKSKFEKLLKNIYNIEILKLLGKDKERHILIIS